METNASKTTSNGQFSKRFHVLYNAKNFANFKLMKKYIQTEGLGRSEKMRYACWILYYSK